MRLVVGTVLSLLSLTTLATSALAASQCHVNSVRLCDQCNSTTHWTVPQAVEGHRFCHIAWQSLGGNMRFEVVQAPHLGAVNIHDYHVGYSGEKLGHDSMVIRTSWLSPNNRPMSGQVTYDIDVVPRQ